MAKALTEKLILQVDKPTKRALAARAGSTDRSIAAVVRIAIREYLKTNGGAA